MKLVGKLLSVNVLGVFFGIYLSEIFLKIFYREKMGKLACNRNADICFLFFSLCQNNEKQALVYVDFMLPGNYKLVLQKCVCIN